MCLECGFAHWSAVPVEVRRGHPVCWNWSGSAVVSCLTLCLLQEQCAALTIEMSFQLQFWNFNSWTWDVLFSKIITFILLITLVSHAAGVTWPPIVLFWGFRQGVFSTHYLRTGGDSIEHLKVTQINTYAVSKVNGNPALCYCCVMFPWALFYGMGFYILESCSGTACENARHWKERSIC